MWIRNSILLQSALRSLAALLFFMFPCGAFTAPVGAEGISSGQSIGIEGIRNSGSAAAGGSLAINGTPQHVSATANSVQVTLSTSVTNCVIIVDVETNETVGTVTVSGSTLGAFTQHAHIGTAGSNNEEFRFFKVAASILSGEVITINNGGNNFITVDAYAIANAHTAAPFDAGGPVTSATDPVSITTVNTNTMAIGAFRIGTANPTAGAGFTQISGADFHLTEYKLLSSAQTLSVTVGTGAGQTNGAIADAIIQGP